MSLSHEEGCCHFIYNNNSERESSKILKIQVVKQHNMGKRGVFMKIILRLSIEIEAVEGISDSNGFLVIVSKITISFSF